jgi:hypothetical protein
MNRCTDFETLVERLLADDIGDADRDRLLRHAESCDECRQYVDLHHRLLGPELDFGLPSDDELATMRSSVLREIRTREAAETATEGGLLATFRSWFGAQVPAGAVVAAMALVLAVGLFAGSRMAPVGAVPAVVEVAGGDEVLARLTEQARANRGLADVENSPWMFTNVSFEEQAGGELAMTFDVTRHLEIRRGAQDPLVKELLVHSLLDPSSVGGRLEAVNVASNVIDPKVKEALIVAVLDDTSNAVRLRALELLAKYNDDPDVQGVLLAVLTDEESVQMRMRALDALAASDLSGERFGEAIENIRREGDDALLVRAARWAPVRPDVLGDEQY